MLKKTLRYLILPLLLSVSGHGANAASESPEKSGNAPTGIFERMIVASGEVTLRLDLNRLGGTHAPADQQAKLDSFRFAVGPNSFFTIRVFNKVLRGPEGGSMGLLWGGSPVLPEPLTASANQLVIEKNPSNERFSLVVRDGKTGFAFFNIAGQTYEYDAAARVFRINGGRLLVSADLASKLGRPADVDLAVGEISIATTMYPIEVTTVVNGAARSSALPARGGAAPDTTAQGPDIIVGDLPDMEQNGAGGSQVGLGVATTSCNNGNVEVDWFQLPNTDHNVIPQNLYRMSGGSDNSERFEQVGQSWLKHALHAGQDNACGFGCIPASDGTHLGVGCSDPYDEGLNADQNNLGSRAWVNPFTGVFPSNSNTHVGHTHTGQSHLIIVEQIDLNTTLNPGATYYAEAQYVNPQEYNWCQTHPGQCNMYNNVSYRRFNVSGTTAFTFSPVGSTVRMSSAINAWTGATINPIEPVPGIDGRAFIASRVTGPVAGVWHYEYALYNQNLDRAIQSFSVPVGCQSNETNPGFHAPENHPGWANDGTQGDAGYSNDPWNFSQTSTSLTWNSETFAQNQNANALRWGTLYNFRFDSDRPPINRSATVGFYKTGAPIGAGILAPDPFQDCPGTPTPTPPPSPTPPATPSPSVSPTPPATPTPPLTPTPTATVAPSSTPTVAPTATIAPSSTPTATVAPTSTPTPTVAPTATVAPTSSPTPTVAPTATVAPTSTPASTPTPGVSPSATPATRALNISTRLLVQTGDNVGIGGFIITGSAPKQVLLRAIGPSLAGAGVTNALADPLLELHGPGGFNTIINDNWRDTQEAEIIATGAAPDNDLESAIVAILAPGTYTAIVRGTNNTTGVALIEAYDLGTSGISKLANISTRAFCGTGTEIVIAGFILGGGGSDRIIVRGLGPSLAAAGVSDVLANPILELRDGNGVLLVADDNWQDNPVQASDLIAADLAPTNPLESGISATLSPGIYTALLAGLNNGTGVGLVEVYDLRP